MEEMLGEGVLKERVEEYKSSVRNPG